MARPFRTGGPRLPVEFSRVALDGRVTLVIDPVATSDVETYWCLLGVSTLEEAIRELAIREKISSAREGQWIGAQTCEDRMQDAGEASEDTRERVSAWLAESEIDALVWTALPSRSPDGTYVRPSADQLIAHLKSLSGPALARAEEYIRRAPPAVISENRALFEHELGWTAQSE